MATEPTRVKRRRPTPIRTTEQGRSTRAIHSTRPDPVTGSLTTPVFQTTTYAQPAIGRDLGNTYSRVGNPTVEQLEQALASFEGVRHGIAFSSGMAATTCLALAFLKSGDEAVCGKVVYGGTTRLLTQVLEGFGVRTRFVDATRPERVAAALGERTRLVIVETPANPTLELCDLTAIGTITAGHPALFVVDNTFLTGALQRPADLGADVVLYSTTKFVEGHNSTVGGAILTGSDEVAERLRFLRKCTGGIQTPWNAWLTLQGFKTLPLRMERHCRSALELAAWLERQSAVARVHYPGLPSFPQRELAERQQLAGGGVVTLELAGGLEAAERFCRGLELCTLAENLGAGETLVTHPPTMTHADVDPRSRREAGISDGMIRISVGLEDPDDLRADLEGALGRVAEDVDSGGRPR